MPLLDIGDILRIEAGQLRDDEILGGGGDRGHCGTIQLNSEVDDAILPSWRQSSSVGVYTVDVEAMGLVKHRSPTEKRVDLFRGLTARVVLLPS